MSLRIYQMHYDKLVSNLMITLPTGYSIYLSNTLIQTLMSLELDPKC